MKNRIGREYFEELYEGSPDPWNFETSEYERKKYRHTLESLGDRTFRRALETGCSIGVFTEMLAPICGELVAVDASERAVSAARERLENLSHVRVERRTLPENMPGGTFDLIVASEVLYYLDREAMLETLRVFEDSLEPGGFFLAVHWRGETKTHPLLGDEVHELIHSRTRLENIKSEAEPGYRLDLFERRPGGSEESPPGWPLPKSNPAAIRSKLDVSASSASSPPGGAGSPPKPSEKMRSAVGESPRISLRDASERSVRESPVRSRGKGRIRHDYGEPGGESFGKERVENIPAPASEAPVRVRRERGSEGFEKERVEKNPGSRRERGEATPRSRRKERA